MGMLPCSTSFELLLTSLDILLPHKDRMQTAHRAVNMFLFCIRKSALSFRQRGIANNTRVSHELQSITSWIADV